LLASGHCDSKFKNLYLGKNVIGLTLACDVMGRKKPIAPAAGRECKRRLHQLLSQDRGIDDEYSGEPISF
jgi:hypothetical protein